MAAKLIIGGIYSMPGEGLVVEIFQGKDTLLFDRQGLQHRIIHKKQNGEDVSVEETALLQINSLNQNFEPINE